jgi:CRISPR/Cas system CMR subunit Cmr4 (Cas7 group RAMP superfamily)
MPIMDLIRALDMRATQEDRVLTKHADPRIILEEGTFDRDVDGNVIIKDIDIIMVPQGSDKEKIGYLTWNGELEAVDKQIQRLIEQQLHITQVSRLLLNADKTQAQTGEAFKVQLFPSILKAEHIQTEMLKPILTTMRVAQKLSGKSGGRSFSPASIRVDWGVDLPENIQSKVQAEVQKVEAGIQTTEEAKKNLDDDKKL